MLRTMWITFISSLFLVTMATAQIPKGNLFLGYSYARVDTNSVSRSNLNGWNGLIEGQLFPLIGVVADVSAHYGTEPATQIACLQTLGVPCPANVSGRVNTYLFGPRVSVPVGGLRPFAEVLIGGAHTSAHVQNISLADTSVATAVGGDVDVRLVPLLGWRVQADWVNTRFFGTTQNNARISTGLVLRF